MLKKQSIFPDSQQLFNPPTIADLAVSGYTCTPRQTPNVSWGQSYSYRGDTFILSAGEAQIVGENMSHHMQENYIKFHFRLSSDKSIHVFDQFGDLECDCPQLVILSGPSDMLKIDLAPASTRFASVTLYALRDFFVSGMGLDLAALPKTLRKIIYPEETAFGLHCMPLTPDMIFAVRAVLAAPCSSPLGDLYYQAKATELMCLVIDRISLDEQRGSSKALSTRKVNRLHEVRNLLNQHYAESITLDTLARQTGLGKTTLTSGFLKLYGMSVFDYIQQERMTRAHHLLQNCEHSVTEIAEAVGYNHLSNFSTAFRNYFGCSPKGIGPK